MTLAQLLRSDDWTMVRLAALVGCHQSTISRLRRRKRRCDLALALSIESATEGRVRAQDLPLTPEAARALARLRPEAA